MIYRRSFLFLAISYVVGCSSHNIRSKSKPDDLTDYYVFHFDCKPKKTNFINAYYTRF